MCATAAVCATAPEECFTTAAQGCNCNDPPQPWPPGANTAAEYLFCCGQVGGSAPPGSFGADPGRCTCVSDWPRACENCYRWWSAVGLEAMVNFALAAGLAPGSDLARPILSYAESLHTHAPYSDLVGNAMHASWHETTSTKHACRALRLWLA